MTAGAIPSEVETFLHNVANCFVKIELIKFFHRNQHLLGTVEDIAVAIGRDKRTTARAVPHLVSAGVLAANGRGGAAMWEYSPDTQMAQRVDAFLAYYKTENGRRIIIRRLLEDEV
jgi:ribosomal protein L34